MEVINNFLAVWGFISIIICIISFFVSSTEYKDCVLILDNPVNDDLKKLTFYHEYPHEYPINEPWQEKTLFVAKNCPVRNIKVYSYNVEKEKWEKKPSMVYKSLEPNEGIIFNIIRPEGMPMHK
ncbi:MAG: hypothetical protein RSC41_03615, partial [Oscillospiraceae bacterium]